MINSLSHRITAISLALLMLLSSTGFSMDMHYCQDQLKSISFLGEAKSCHDLESTPPCHKAKKTCNHSADNDIKKEKDNCCHNEDFDIEKSDVDATSLQLTILQDIQLNFVAVLIAVYLYDYNIEASIQAYEHYRPPLPDRDILVLYQSFLI